MGAYLQNPDATGDCNYCQYGSGDTFLSAINVKYSERGRNIGIYCCYIISNIAIILLASRFLKYTKR
jgi:ATP-binding cassette subfamily G (WHITE) protein 2 (SNQ2)